MNTSSGYLRTLIRGFKAPPNYYSNYYPKGKIVIILGNAKIHNAKLLKLFLDEMNDRIQLMFLAPYNPNLNLIDGLWGLLKSSIINNIFFNIYVLKMKLHFKIHIHDNFNSKVL